MEYPHLTIDHCLLMFKLSRRYKINDEEGRYKLLDKIYKRDYPNEQGHFS